MNIRLLTWWKWIIILIMPYIILMGFLIPLGQGITHVSPVVIKAGQEVDLLVSGYNTNFKASDDIHAWLKHDALHVQNTSAKVLNPTEASFHFILPPYTDSTQAFVDLALVMDTPEGPIVLPSAVSMSNLKPSESITHANTWSDQPLIVRPESNFNYPYRNILSETIRNTYFHVPLWFAMVALFMVSVYHSVKYLRFNRFQDDSKAESLVSAGILFGILGTVTGAVWAKSTWGSYWSFDVKQNMAAISLLIYSGYFLLKRSLNDPDAKSRVSAVYNIFAFALMIPLIFIIPRRFDSLHPGNGGNPALGSQDLDNTMRLVFYPAVLVYILLGLWLAQLSYRISMINNKLNN